MNQKNLNTALDTMLKMRMDCDKDSIKHQVLSDALDKEEAKGVDSSGDAVHYLQDVINHGCVSGICSGLIYYHDTHAFYAKHADEIDEMLEQIVQDMGEPFDTRAGLEDMRNRLAWMAYEETARAILEDLPSDI